MPKYPGVVVELDGEDDDDASAILGRVKRALAQAGVPDEEIEQFTTEAAVTTCGAASVTVASISRRSSVEACRRYSCDKPEIAIPDCENGL